jgi:hypothetical protein
LSLIEPNIKASNAGALNPARKEFAMRRYLIILTAIAVLCGCTGTKVQPPPGVTIRWEYPSPPPDWVLLPSLKVDGDFKLVTGESRYCATASDALKLARENAKEQIIEMACDTIQNDVEKDSQSQGLSSSIFNPTIIRSEYTKFIRGGFTAGLEEVGVYQRIEQTPEGEARKAFVRIKYPTDMDGKARKELEAFKVAQAIEQMKKANNAEARKQWEDALNYWKAKSELKSRKD